MTAAHALPPEPPAQVAYVAWPTPLPPDPKPPYKPDPAAGSDWLLQRVILTDIGCEPDVLCTVLTRTKRVGWPHSITTPEKIEIASAVMHRYARGGSGVACVFPSGTPARAACTVVRQARPRVVRVRVKVWEDGSFVLQKRPAKHGSYRIERRG